MSLNRADHLIGVGIDVVELDRAKRFVYEHELGLKSFLTPAEYGRYSKSSFKPKSFAILFAAKEAASKALGFTLAHPKSFRDFRVTLDPRGGPPRVVWVGDRKTAGPHIYPRRVRFKTVLFGARDAMGVIAIAYFNPKTR